MTVRVDDINLGGHLAHDAVLSLAHEARMRWLRSLGFASELDVAGSGLIMTEAAVLYRAEGTYGMDLRIEVAPAQVRPATFHLVYRLSDEATGVEIARATTRMVFFDYEARCPTRAPDAFLDVVRTQERPLTTP
ncbi:MAG TPA: thioesterase family protein [Anaeromyxobacter sp.]|nr:thioesterase family protein [Anaeromyxobacter sp.]